MAAASIDDETRSVDILLVDDEERNLMALDAVLTDPTYRLLHARDADEALTTLVSHEVAVIVLDVMMPGTDGFALARIIRGSKRFRETPIIFLSAHLIDQRDVLEGYVAGAVDYLTKPFEPAILRQKVGIFVELYRRKREISELNRSLERRVSERTAELEESEAALRLADQQRTAFLATLAHELRNPLAPLRTGLDVLLQSEAVTGTDRRTVQLMTRQVTYLVHLVDDLLDASRATRGVLHLKRAMLDLRDVARSALQIAQPNIDARGQSVVLELPARPVPIFADETRICQIMANLLHNACKFAPPSAPIEVGVTANDSEAAVVVIDEGPGIPESQLPHIFEMFTTIDREQRGAGGGLGIGLALSRKLAELHDGSLVAENVENGGAKFTLTLPLASDAELSNRPRSSEPPPPARPAVSRTLDVVVVEDYEDAAEMMREWLEALGHHVRIAHTGREGLDLIFDQRPDVVLCDLGLPGMDGTEVCRRVKREMKHPPAMVALTGWGSENDRRRTESAGFDRHLVKPVAPPQLREVLASIELKRTASTAAAD